MKIFRLRERRPLAAAVRAYCAHACDGPHTALRGAVATAAILDAQVGRYAGLPETPAGLHALLTDVDIAGRFRTESGRVTFAFGEYQDRPLDEVARADPGYLRWFLGQEFLDDAKALVERALARAGRLF